MAEIDIVMNSNIDQIVDVACRECKTTTKHIVLSDVQLKGFEDMGAPDYYKWQDEYQIVKCNGCESISFRKTHKNSIDCIVFDSEFIEHIIHEDIFPNPVVLHSALEDAHLLPSNIQMIYLETIKSINTGQSVLTGIGIRAIVETICKDKNAKGQNLCAKINDLVTQDVLTQEGANILHKLRTLGNKAAHEVKPHDNVRLSLALDVIDHLLQGVYILPDQTSKTLE